MHYNLCTIRKLSSIWCDFGAVFKRVFVGKYSKLVKKYSVSFVFEMLTLTYPKRFPLFVPKRSWPFNVSDRIPFLTVWMTVPYRFNSVNERFVSVYERFRSFCTVLRLKFKKSVIHYTVGNNKFKRLKTPINAKESH